MMVRSLRSTAFLRFLHYYGPVRLPSVRCPVIDSRSALGLCPHGLGLSGSSTILSVRAVPNHPGGSRKLRVAVASLPVAGFTLFGGLALPIRVTRPNRVRFRYGSHVRSPGLRHPGLLHGPPGSLADERPIVSITTFQVIRIVRLILTHRRREGRSRSRTGGGLPLFGGMPPICSSISAHSSKTASSGRYADTPSSRLRGFA